MIIIREVDSSVTIQTISEIVVQTIVAVRTAILVIAIEDKLFMTRAYENKATKISKKN